MDVLTPFGTGVMVTHRASDTLGHSIAVVKLSFGVAYLCCGTWRPTAPRCLADRVPHLASASTFCLPRPLVPGAPAAESDDVLLQVRYVLPVVGTVTSRRRLRCLGP